MPFRFERLDIPDVILIEARIFEDERGFFMESYKSSDFAAHGIPRVFVQDNYSYSRRGVLRGLHYQAKPKAQGKLVTVIRGEIYDVAVDLRKGSPTYGRWVGRVLAAEHHALIYVPIGFAHGFLVLSEDADVVYKVTEEYAPEFDRGIAWNDPDLAIPWPIKPPILSPKDATLPLIRQADHNFTYEELAR
jgi:dTDP-4-dehydrorhamnose 3,5-epimerase